MKWGKRAGKIVLLLLLAELLFFFVLGTRIRRQLEAPTEILGRIERLQSEPAHSTSGTPARLFSRRASTNNKSLSRFR